MDIYIYVYIPIYTYMYTTYIHSTYTHICGGQKQRWWARERQAAGGGRADGEGGRDCTPSCYIHEKGQAIGHAYIYI